MREIQDMYDVCGIANPLMWSLMDIKYVISDRVDSNQILLPVYKGERNILYNRSVLPRAFFVSEYKQASGIEILNHIKRKDFDPREVAYVMEDPRVSIDPPDSTTFARYVAYGLQNLAIKVRASGNNLLFLSESWYPKGWKAYVDGHETPIYRLNYMFRGVVVPSGEHTVTMRMVSETYNIGETMSLWINIVVLGGVLGLSGYNLINRKNAQKSEQTLKST